MNRIVGGFLKFLETEKGYSDNTVAAYRNDLSQFTNYIIPKLTHGWADATRTHVDDYISQLKNNGTKSYSSSTIARKVAAIKSFFHYLIAEGVIQNDPTAALSSPKVKKRLPKAISVADINKLLAATMLSNAPKARRELTMLALLYASGMRVTELVSLNVDDVNIVDGTVRVKGKKSGIKERFIPITGDAFEALKDYIDSARRQLTHNPKEHALFLNHRGQRLTRQGSWLIIKRYVEEVGIEDQVTPHTLRHSFAAHKLSHGQSLQDIQKLLGHANISTTQVYTHLANETEKE